MTSTEQEIDYLPPSPPPRNEGKTLAAWVTTVVVIVGGALASVAMVFAEPGWVWAGLGLAVVGLVVGKVLQALGYGKGGQATVEREARRAAAGKGH